ncbi:MAG: ATP-dependent hsl protease ATP-binding subunit HslU [uncultured Campylobacterales bacterium]|uniref:ATP-dependent hsl protease ATP-binding subunit HslU n=1 Tax=uncultured Campylobacterales bacterium TaxID=352960 RepID=A0A6S6TL22_9BACT|nr:MAG: ATP-dependent hsl protease ATP-binding subunit HslU [uncultured Campylobacterales bacterium]
MNLTPKEIVKKLDEYVIGQKDAKKAIALALRNRHRRMQLDSSLQEEIVPKNILMIGNTGVGKTEIARRLSKMMGLPFIKVEASKYTEVGFVGRDVESMVRDLVGASISIVQEEYSHKNQENIKEYIEDQILQKLLPTLPKGATEEKLAAYEQSKTKMRIKLHNGDLDELKIKINIPQSSLDSSGSNIPPEMQQIQETFVQILTTQKKVEKEVSIKKAKELLKTEASEKLLDMESIKLEALSRAENSGIIFLDEIDKIAVSSNSSSRQDPSKEGVQRDLLPIVEGSTVNTKHGVIKTDHILFISAGAFHLTNPNDLIPELQGRFPIRVELEALSEDILYKILTNTKNSLLKQYQSLLGVEKVELIFDDEAIKTIAHITQMANEKNQDIGARRLHTVIENVLEDISYNADEYTNQKVTITKELVHKKLDSIIQDQDVSKYIL